MFKAFDNRWVVTSAPLDFAFCLALLQLCDDVAACGCGDCTSSRVDKQQVCLEIDVETAKIAMKDGDVHKSMILQQADARQRVASAILHFVTLTGCQLVCLLITWSAAKAPIKVLASYEEVYCPGDIKGIQPIQQGATRERTIGESAKYNQPGDHI